ncbi:ribose ABC transporter substrate-binding protein [Actinomadura spongiicola]|uniref:Ribose ABC transporter substrate-binding protein n=1 Tax=Actinomadura spongiicola TaxID=2303421 RepID=A0A372GFZ4_9ACTN|nr:substrate-binding domain-containing protein [Actinomadura spongiicola]RFS84291.1 ribose ABC transporter substrate-binding protein [Actinomadura spongiicola]
MAAGTHRADRRRHLRTGVTLTVAPLILAVGCGGAGSPGSAGKTPTGSPSAVQASGTGEGFASMSDVCGSEPITVGLADGYGANSWRKISRAELEAEAKKCPAVKKVIYTDAQGSAQKAISDVNTLVSQGAKAIVVLPDSGPAMIPALRAAMRAGVKVVITPGDLGGKAGQDYVTAVYDSPESNGRVWAEWMAKQLNGKGNVVFLGGTPGNPTSPRVAAGIRESLAKHPQMKLLAGPVDTNWDVAKTQQVTAGLLTRFPKIDGIISDYGGSTIGAIRAFQAAGRPLVPIATNDFNQLSCTWKAEQAGKGFPLATVSSRPWITRIALRQAVAAAHGKQDREPTVLKLSLFEDSTSSDNRLAVRCDPQLPPDAILSSTLTSAEMATLFGK